MSKIKTLNQVNKLERLLNQAVGRELILRADLNRWRASGPYDINRLFSHENDILLKLARINSIQRRILDSLKARINDLYLESNFKPLENEILN
jgi:hypothetical protein